MPTAGLYANTRENRDELLNFGLPLGSIFPMTAARSLAAFNRVFVAAHGDATGDLLRTGPRPKERSFLDQLSAPIDWALGVDRVQRATSSFDAVFLNAILEQSNLPANASINIMACNSGVAGGIAEKLSRIRRTARVFAATNTVNGNTYHVQNGGVWVCYEDGQLTERHGADWQ